MTDRPAWHLRITGEWDDDSGNWLVIREDEDGHRLPGSEEWEDGWGVVDLGDAIDAAHARRVDLHASDQVIERMRAERGDAWWPRHPRVYP